MTWRLKARWLVLALIFLGSVAVFGQDGNNPEIVVELDQQISDAAKIILDSEQATLNLFVLAKQIQAAGSYDSAITFLEKLRQSTFTPDSIMPHVLVHLGDSLLALDRVTEAAAVYREASTTYGTNYEAGDYYSNLSRFVQFRLGRCYIDSEFERYSEAATAYGLFFSLPGPQETSPEVEKARYLLGWSHYQHAYTLREADPNSAAAAAAYGEAITAFKAVLSSGIGSTDQEFIGLVNFYLARSYQFASATADSEQGIGRIAALTPQNRYSAAAVMEAGSYYLDKGRHENAVTAYRKVESYSTGGGTVTPTDRLAAVARSNMARSFFERGDITKAIAQQQKTIDISAFVDRKAVAQFAIGWYLLEAGRYTEAVEKLGDVFKIDGGTYIPKSVTDKLILESQTKMTEKLLEDQKKQEEDGQ